MVATPTILAWVLFPNYCLKLTWVVLLQFSRIESLIQAQSLTYLGKLSSQYLALKLVSARLDALVGFQHLRGFTMNHMRPDVKLWKLELQNS